MRWTSGWIAASCATLLGAWTPGCFLNGGPFESSGAGAASTTSTATTSAAGGSTTTTTGTGPGGDAGGGAGGTGGAGPVCGDTIIEEGEDCDDGDAAQGDGCHQCRFDCGCPWCEEGTACADCPSAGRTTFKDLAGGGCYIDDPSPVDWSAAQAACEGMGEGWELFAPSTVAEMNMLWGAAGFPVDDHLSANGENRFWTGATDQFSQGTFQWSNGETWNDPPAGLDVLSVEFGEDCLVIGYEGAHLALRGRECYFAYRFVCEHAPF